MATNPYFNFFPKKPSNEQDMFERMVTECVQIFGEDCYYLPRESWSAGNDPVLGEDISAKFTKSYVIDMYHKTYEAFQGMGDLFSKLGHRQDDNITVTIAARTWKKLIPPTIRTYPREGDLIYVPSQRRIWEVKFVEQHGMFFSIGKKDPYQYELRCELFKYSHENIDTGIEDIDILEPKIAYTIRMNLGPTGNGDFQIGEVVTSNNVSATVSDWFYQTKIIDVITVKGEFTAGTTLRGNTSNASWTIQTVSDRDNFNEYDRTDAQDIQTAANTIINRTEINPFGMP